MLETSLTAGPIPSIEKLDTIARKTGLIMRRSNRFSAHGFLLALMQSVLRGNNSLNHLALGLGQHQARSMSRQAMHLRLNEASSSFLIRVLHELIKERSRSIGLTTNKLPIARLLIEDCTVIPMHRSNHETFPGNGNGKFQTAGAKVHLLADWLSGDILECGLHTARSADQGLNSEVLDHCRQGDLIVRDMGFFHFQTLQHIENTGAYWLSRLPATTTAYDKNGKSLDQHLKKETRNQFELTVHLGQKRQNKCRLIATRLTRAQAEKNRRLRRRKSAKHRHKASKIALMRDEWSILVTNLTKKQASPKRLHEIYNLRWSIEIQFRGMKQSCRLEKTLNHKAHQNQLEALILAAMIYQVLTLKIHHILRKLNIAQDRGKEISYEKLCDAIAIHIISLTSKNSHHAFNPDPRHLYHDTRKRQTLYAKGIQALT